MSNSKGPGHLSTAHDNIAAMEYPPIPPMGSNRMRSSSLAPQLRLRSIPPLQIPQHHISQPSPSTIMSSPPTRVNLAAMEYPSVPVGAGPMRSPPRAPQPSLQSHRNRSRSSSSSSTTTTPSPLSQGHPYNNPATMEGPPVSLMGTNSMRGPHALRPRLQSLPPLQMPQHRRHFSRTSTDTSSPISPWNLSSLHEDIATTEYPPRSSRLARYSHVRASSAPILNSGLFGMDSSGPPSGSVNIGSPHNNAGGNAGINRSHNSTRGSFGPQPNNNRGFPSNGGGGTTYQGSRSLDMPVGNNNNNNNVYTNNGLAMNNGLPMNSASGGGESGHNRTCSAAGGPFAPQPKNASYFPSNTNYQNISISQAGIGQQAGTRNHHPTNIGGILTNVDFNSNGGGLNAQAKNYNPSSASGVSMTSSVSTSTHITDSSNANSDKTHKGSIVSHMRKLIPRITITPPEFGLHSMGVHDIPFVDVPTPPAHLCISIGCLHPKPASSEGILKF